MTDSDEIKADIVATRAELAETAEALAAKLDEKAQLGKRIAVGIAGAAVAVVIVQQLRTRLNRRKDRSTERRKDRGKDRSSRRPARHGRSGR